jgi:hypothetical protein
MKNRFLTSLVVLGSFTLFVHAWKTPHWLTALGVVLLAAKSAKGWNWRHYLTLFGAVALAGISTWLKYGGPDFQIGDTPLLGLIVLVLRAMYQTPPQKTA